jgi:hypothetical protein
MTLRIAMYCAKAGNWFDKTINWGSGGGGFSHCEIVWPDGWSFSSTTRDGGTSINNSGTPIKPKEDGTRWKQIDFKPGHWLFHELPDVTPDRLAVMKAYADSILDARYDWWGAMRVSVAGRWWMRQHGDKYFCSEAVLEVCHAGDYFNSLHSLISPNQFSKKLELRA